MDSKIGFEMSLIIVEAIRGRCASFMSLPATVSEIFGGQTTPSIFSSIDCLHLISYGGCIHKVYKQYIYITICTGIML